MKVTEIKSERDDTSGSNFIIPHLNQTDYVTSVKRGRVLTLSVKKFFTECITNFRKRMFLRKMKKIYIKQIISN